MKVSIITVSFNSADTIKDTIKSVIDQDHQNIEHIIIDGGSQDNTLQIINEYKDKIALIISEPDNGIYNAMNKGIMLATGDIIGILNSDDFYIDNSVVSKIVSAFNSKNVESVYSDLIYVNGSDLSKGVRLYSSENFTPGLLPYGIMPAHPTFFVKREIYKKYGVFKENYKILADFELIVRFLYVNRISYYYMKGITVKMRTGGVSTSWKSLVTNNIEMVEACRENGIRTNYLKISYRYWSKLLSLLIRFKW